MARLDWAQLQMHGRFRPALSQIFLQKYNAYPPPSSGRDYASAKYLYMWISMTYPEAMEHFGQNEIAVDNSDINWPYFVDGWGMPIMFLRWAPGFSSGVGLNPNPFNPPPPPSNPTQPRTDLSDIQTGDPVNDHDPFDSRRIFPGNYTYPNCPSAYRLIPLIFSGGPDQAGHVKKYGITVTAQIGGVEYSDYYGVNPSVNTLDDLNPYATVPTDYGNVLIGSPSKIPSDPAVNCIDNIHNHHIEQQ